MNPVMRYACSIHTIVESWVWHSQCAAANASACLHNDCREGQAGHTLFVSGLPARDGAKGAAGCGVAAAV